MRQPSRGRPPSPGFTVAVKPWRKVVFGDLHVSASTLKTCLQVLARVRELAVEQRAGVVCTGDFWEQRGMLYVRQLHALQDELERHAEAGIRWKLIPGNHDQVSRDGKIHGLRVFEQYDNLEVVTEPVIDRERGLAYLPWREDAAEQDRMLREVPAGFTVFGHLELEGAVANNGHESAGRFGPAAARHLRAVYLGHYHKRQRIGDVWYLGSPYETNAGERGQPHGIAVVRSATITPAFIDLDELPKYWRFTWPDDRKLFSGPRPQDVVEVLAARQELGSPAFQKGVARIAARDVRQLPLPAQPDAGAPAFALTVPEAVDRYVREVGGKNARLRELGHELLAAVADKRAVVPVGRVVRFSRVTATGFCRIPGTAELPLDRRGTMLLRGRMRAGKTAISADAITWCLYGVTSPRPRKPGASGVMRADDVVHDDAQEARVTVELTLDDDSAVYEITRTKRRGSGSKVTVTRAGEPWQAPGISDQQQSVDSLVGFGVELWRAYVVLGQGEVQSFVTDSSRARAELLERAFQLQVCPLAAEQAKKRRKAEDDRLEPLRQELAGATARLAELAELNCDREHAAWEQQRRYDVARQRELAAAAIEDVAQLTRHLQHDAAWRERLEHVRGQIDQLVARPKPADLTPKVGRLHADIGAARAEHGTAERDLEQLRKSYRDAQAAAVTCRACGQPIPPEQREQHLQELEGRIVGQQAAVQAAAARVQNLEIELGQVVAGRTPAADSTAAELRELRQHEQEAGQAIAALDKIRARKTEAERARGVAEQRAQDLEAEPNPWDERKRAHEARVQKLRDKIGSAEQAIALGEAVVKEWQFWVDGFAPAGIPVLVLRTALHELEGHANAFLSRALGGQVVVQLSVDDTDIALTFYEQAADGQLRERDFAQLSGGQRRCIQMAFAPFALGEMVASRVGVRVHLLVVDEVTTHLDQETKPLVCQALRELDRETVVVIDHDPSVQSEFDTVYDVTDGQIERAA